jgi:peptidoglycan/xylan/chitin deacetylase (PgdA/CDA1 family)
VYLATLCFVTRFLLTFSLLFLAAGGVQEVSAASSAAAQPSVRIPILVYHHIRETKPYPTSTWSYKMSVSPSVFEQQMTWIKDHGYTTITLDQALDQLRGKPGPEKPVVITFDDNNRTQYTLAFPILKKHHQIGVFYLITNRLKNHAFILEDEVKTMAEDGMDIQSHTVTHSTLSMLNLQRLDEELMQSKKTLETITGKSVYHIAYPSTGQNKIVREHAKEAGYTTGTIMDPRVATPQDDVYKLPRIMMTDDTNLQKVLP